MIDKYRKIFLLLILVIISSTSSVSGFSGNDKKVIAKATRYEPGSKGQSSLYEIDVADGRVTPLFPGLTEKLTTIRLSPDSKYALGTLFNSKKFTRDVQIVDLKHGKSFNLTSTPKAGVSKDGSIVGTFKEYGFSPDSKWAVMTFPDCVDIKPNITSGPLVCVKMKPNEPCIVFIDISAWLEKKDPNAILKIAGDDFPAFSPSGNQFLAPLTGEKGGRKIVLYKFGIFDLASKQSLTSYQLPFNNVTQASFASEKLIYIMDGDDFITYDISQKSVELKRSLSGYNLASMGLVPPAMPYTVGLSDGLISFGGKYYAFLMPNGYIPIPRNLLEKDINPRRTYSQRLMLVYGDIDSPYFQRMDIPPLPAEAYDQYILYHRLFIPSQCGGRYAVMSSSGWNYQAFRIIDFSKREFTEPITGFFVGLSVDGRSVIYTQCGVENDCFKGNNDFTWETIPGGKKEIAVTVNLLKYRNLETEFETILMPELSQTTEGFFVN